MDVKLLNMKAGELMTAFGTGGHKPGSGSAASFLGCLAANLTSNVIDLTEEYKKRSKIYQRHIFQLRSDLINLRSNIIPKLEQLVEEDSIQFDKVIKARKARNEEKDQKLKEIKAEIAISELRRATEIPFEIANLCYEVGGIAVKVFDYGYISARGESAEGIKFASTAIFSCISIIELNLQTIPLTAWTIKIRKQKEKLYEQYEELNLLGKNRLEVLRKDADDQFNYELSAEVYRKGNLSNSIKNEIQLEEMVHNLHVFVWRNKKKIWKNGSEKILNYKDILQPQDILSYLLKYSVIQKDSLGKYYEGNQVFDVAGLIDKKNKRVEISREYNLDIMRFTTAHELGHALLHSGTLLHRDRPLDGSKINRNPNEVQADKFAALFLMPGKMVKQVFEELFETTFFKLDEYNALQLGIPSFIEFQKENKSLRSISRLLVKARRFGVNKFTPLAVIFGVSDETMAIRLEELGLIDYIN